MRQYQEIITWENWKELSEKLHALETIVARHLLFTEGQPTGDIERQYEPGSPDRMIKLTVEEVALIAASISAHEGEGWYCNSQFPSLVQFKGNLHALANALLDKIGSPSDERFPIEEV